MNFQDSLRILQDVHEIMLKIEESEKITPTRPPPRLFRTLAAAKRHGLAPGGGKVQFSPNSVKCSYSY